MLLTLLFILSILFIIALFSSSRLSPIPYFPTNKKDLPLIIKALKLKNNQIVVDLGAGDGVVIFEAAKEAFDKKVNTKFIAIEINPILVLILHFQRLFHPNKRNIIIIWADFFKVDLKLLTFNFKLLTFYLYISPWLIEKVIKNLIPQLAGKNFSAVSYMYPIPSLKKSQSWHGEYHIFRYN